VTPTARRWYAANAVVAWLGLAVSFVLTVTAMYPSTVTVPTRYGFDNPDGVAGLGGRLADWLSYFTIWSNVTVAVVMTLLAIPPLRDSGVFRAVRLDAVLMITITGIVYAVVLAPTSVQRGWDNLSNSLLHQVTPLLTLGVWAVFGPRGWVGRSTVLGALGIPLMWVGWMLLRGGATGTYPYPFVDVAVLGLGPALINVAGILAAGTLIGLGFLGLDRVLARRTAPATPAAA
jgi:hypothetical protein